MYPDDEEVSQPENPIYLGFEQFLQNVEVTEFGKLQLEKVRSEIVEQKAYFSFNHDHPNLYSDVSRDGFLKGQLILIDSILECIKTTK